MKYLLISIILFMAISCDDYSTQPIAPGFDPPVVNELDIYLEDGTASGKLKFGPVLSPIFDDFYSEINVSPSIATDVVTISLSNEDDTQSLIYVVRANQTSKLNDFLFLGSNLSLASNNNAIFAYDNFFNIGVHTLSLNLDGFEEGLYVVYLKNMIDGKILGEAAFFKTNEVNKERIYKQLKIGKYR